MQKKPGHCPLLGAEPSLLTIFAQNTLFSVVWEPFGTTESAGTSRDPVCVFIAYGPEPDAQHFTSLEGLWTEAFKFINSILLISGVEPELVLITIL